MKRITSSLLALLLALSMLIGMVPAVYATDKTDTIESIDPTETGDLSETEDVLDESKDVAAQAAEGTDVAEVGGVAAVGTTTYNTLEEAINALSDDCYTLTLLNESAWDTATPVYWAAGTQSGYVAKLTDALTAAYKANAANIKIVCRPGADVGTMTHGHVADNITIYGNNAYISGGECELEVDTYKFSRETGAQDTTNGVYLDKDIVINAYELDNLGVWGERHTTHTVNVNLTDCDGKALEKNVQRVYISGTTGKNEITLKNCDFITAATAVYSNADGQISIDTCSFTGSKVPVNFNHKANGEQRLTVSNSTFKNCGDNGEWNQFAAPVRFVNSGSGTQSATVDTCTFTNTVGSNGDILIGDGRTGQESNNVSLTVTNTTATVQAQKPGYYDGTATDTSKGAETTVESSKTLNTSVEEMLPTALTAYVTVNGGTEQYATLDEAIAAAEPENGVITYTVTGKVNANGESWIQVARDGLTGLTEVKFVGADANAEICITNSTAVLADQSYDIDVSFKDLTLSHPNGAWVGDLGHATNYFTTVLRNTDAANNTVTYTNCTFPNGACNNQYGKTVYANCNFTNATSGKYNLWNYGGNTEIKNSTFTGTRGIKAYSEGTDGGDISISGTTFDDLNEKAAIVASKPVGIVLDNVAVTGDSSKGLFTRDISGNDELTISATGTGISGTFDITSDATGANAKDELNISAGTFNSEVSSDYCADGFEVKANENGTYGVVESAETKPDGYQEDANGNVTISDEDGLFWFAKQVNEVGNTFSGKTVALANNIALTKTWEPIGDFNGTAFKGTFDGGNHTVSGVRVTEYSTNGVGFFAKTHIATIKNLTVEGTINAHGCNYVGGIVGHGYATITNCTFKGTITNAGGFQIGGIAGSGGFTVSNCSVYGDISGEGWVGGIAGNVQDGGAYTNCYVEGTISAEKAYYGVSAAGIAAIPLYKSQVISGCYCNANVKCGGEEINAPIIGGYNGDNNITADTELFIQDNSWNKQKNPNDSYEISESGTVIKGKTASRDNNLIMLEDDLKYVTGDLSDVKIMAGSAVTQDQVNALAVASNGANKYASLGGAIAAAKDGDTVTLLKSCNGNGIKIETKNFATKGLTVDFGGNTYSVGGVLVGSTGTGTNAFQLLQGGKVTFRNGTIAGVTEGTKPAEDTPNWHGAPALVIQNYCDLTLKSMTITGGDETVYTMSNNHGNIVIEDTTITAGKAKGYGSGPFAFDVCGYSSYNGVSVTVTGSSTINGDIEVSRSSNNKNPVGLTLEGGTITGKLVIDSSITLGENTTITKSDSFEVAAPAGYKWDKGTLTKITYVAEVNGKQYDSLQAAITAAADGDTVTLLADTTEDVVISKNITLDLGGKTLTNTNAGKATISVNGGTVTVKNGNVIGGTDYYNIEVTKGSNANLTLEGVTATAGNTGSSMIDNWGTLTITSGTYTGGLDTVKNEPNATLTINGGTFTLTKGTSKGFTGVVFNYGKLTITGGEFTQSDKSAPYGQAQVIHTDKSGSAVPSTTITGGTFKNLCTRSTAFVVRATNAAAGATKVSGGTFNKSISVDYCADGYIPTKNADGTYGVKEGKYVAQIGSKYYEKLADAIRLAAKGATIELLTDVNEAVTVSDKKNITLDLNGFTLTNTEGEHTIVNNGTLTIKDSSTAQTGTVDNVTHGRGALVNNGTVILSGGTFERSAEKGKFEPYGNGGNSWYTIANYGTMTIDNGTTVKNAGGYSSNIRNGGQDSTAKLTINGGTFDGGVNTVKNDANGVLEIKGGELKNTAQYVIMNWNKATISGGTFETAETAGAVLFSSAYQNQSAFCGELTITGGTFTAAGSKLIDDAYDADNHGTVKISGGSFNRAVDPKHCDTGFIPTQNADGTYGVKEGVYVAKVDNVKYETLQAAINAAKGGSTVRLLANVTLTETAVFPAGKTVHLNLVGHNITAAGTALRINGKTDIQSTDGVGTIESTGNVAVAVGDNANLTVYSGTLKGREGAVITGTSTGAKIEIRKNPTLIATDNAVIAGNGSKRDGKPNTILVKGGTFIGGIVTDGYIACGIYAPWNDNVTVSGGTFNITNGAGIVARAGTVKVTGGTFNCGDGTAKGWVGDSKNKVPNAALVFDEAANYPALTESSQILVSGGTFSTDPAANGAKLADGYVANKDESGMYKVGKAEPVAEINGVKYDTLQAAINAAQATQGGATITLLKNINTESYYTVNGDNPVTIDLAGCNITGSGISGLFYVTAKGDLTIKGEGTVTAVEDTGAAMAVWVRSPIAKVTLEGGTYTQQITNTADPHFDLIYVERGNVYVKGGTYKGFTPDWTLNCKDEHYLSKEANIEVTGGTFYGFDPGANPEGEGTTYVKTGYVSTKNADGTYGVKEGTYVAAIGEKKYATLAEAVDAAKNGDTITLIADVEQNTMLVIKKDITLDLAGKKIFNTTDIWSDANGSYELLSIEAKVTITGNGTIDAKENDCYTINVKNGDLTIENGTFYGNVSVVQVEAGMLTINGGKFDLHQKWEGKNTYLINCIDDAFVAKTAKVAIYGGDFVDFDPNVSPEKKIDGKAPSFAAPGVGITKNENNTFTAQADMAAQIVDADGNSVKAYATLKEAVNAAKSGETVIVLKEATVEEMITAEANITIDLNQKTVTVADGAGTMLKTTGDVTIKNGTLTSAVTANIINAYGKLKLESVKIYGSTVDGSNLVNVLGNAEVTIDAASEIEADGVGVAVFVGAKSADKDAKYTLNIYGKVIQKGKSYAISGNGSYPGTSYINIYEGAEVKASNIAENNDCCAIYQPQAGEINVYGGLVEGYCAIVMKSGTLNISGGTVRGIRNDNVLGDNNSAGNGASYDGSAIVVDSRKTGYAGNVKINVTGGTVESYYSTAIREIGNDSSMTQLVELTVTGGEILGASKNLTNAENDILVRDISVSNVAISGGTFNHEVQADYCAVGYEPSEKDASGMYTVQKVSGNAYYTDDDGNLHYGYLTTLLNNEATVGRVITLIDSVDYKGSLVVEGNRTINLAGYTFESEFYVFVTNGCGIKDSTDGSALIKVAPEKLVFMSNNEQLPIYDSANKGYRLFNCKVKGKCETNGDSATIWVLPEFENKAAYKLLKSGNAHNATISVTISWTGNDGPAAQEFTFKQSLIDIYAAGEGGATFTLRLTGLGTALSGEMSNIKAQSSIKSGAGVSFTGKEYSLSN